MSPANETQLNLGLSESELAEQEFMKKEVSRGRAESSRINYENATNLKLPCSAEKTRITVAIQRSNY
jgi:hypothetical protein